MSISRFIAAVSSGPLGEVLQHHEEIPARPGSFRDPAAPLPDALARALQAQGINRLYSHQADAIDIVRNGGNVVAVTPTASGKSLIFNLPVLERLMGESPPLIPPGNRGGEDSEELMGSTPPYSPPTSQGGKSNRIPTSQGGKSNETKKHAIYLFPLKALEQDQAAKLNALIEAAGLQGGQTGMSIPPTITVGIYDGDTPNGERQRMRANPPNVLITNPDMLHLGIMSYHANWEDLLRNLQFIVLDELHVYRGVFGSHILHVLRRLIRLCNYYGARPQVIAASATIAGARELAETLTGLEFQIVEESGAPVSPRHFLFFNPQFDSYLTFALRLFVTALQSGLKVIAFTKARRTTELLHRWLNEAYPEFAGTVSSYRAGFRPEERRDIERRLVEGSLQGVISTSALELGIDIGGLDVCVLVGYPGTIATTWQRAGRVGRGGDPSAVCLVAGQDQLDQYFMRHPADFFGRTVESAVVDPHNEQIARQHILSAANEIPIRTDEAAYAAPELRSLVEELAASGKLLLSAGGDRWFSANPHPQRELNLREVGEQFSIEVDDSRTQLGVVSGRAVFAECHPGAIYLHRAEQYEVLELDLAKKLILVKQVDVNYYTMPLFEKDTEILEVRGTADLPGGGKVQLAELKVTQQLVGYQKRRVYGQDLLSQHDLEYPPTSYQTIGLAITIPAGTADLAAERELHFRGGIHGVEHAMLGIAPLFALCDRRDMGGYSQIMHPQIGGPAIFMYDGHPGGIGLSARLFDVFGELTERTLKLIESCECAIGCPSCIQSPKCGHGNIPLDKAAAVLTLQVLTGRQAVPEAAKRVPEPQPVKQTTAIPPSRKAPPVIPKWSPDKSGVIFDLETQRSADEVGGWRNVKAMGLAWGVVYRFPQDEWLDFAEKDAERLVDTLRAADLVVGFNSVRFDYEVLKGYSGYDFRRLPSYDILQEIEHALGHRLKLDQVASATVGAVKSADGLQSLEWWKNGEVEKVAEYCRKDVEVTRDVFYFLLEHGYLLFERRNIGLARIPMRMPEIK